MSQTHEAPGLKLISYWNRLESLPFGRRAFTWLVGRSVPYSGALGARIEHLEPGYAKLTLKDRPRVRNHLRCVHAVAMVNLGEFVSGLAMLSALPPGVGGIVTEIRAEYLKKARGELTAESRATVDLEGLEGSSRKEQRVAAEIFDASGEIVCRVHAQWLLRSKR